MSLRKSARPIILLMLTAALLITSCNVGATAEPTQDINALSTAIVETTVAQLGAQLTQTAQAAPTNTTTAPTLALPTLDTSGVPSPTLDVSALPTFSFESTVAPSNTPASGVPTSGVATTVVLPTSQGQATAALGDACDNLQFLYDVTIPDGTVVNGGETFTKIWAVKNIGTCLWDDGYSLLLIGKDPAVGAYNFLFTVNRPQDFVAGGFETQLGASVTAPCAPGSYSATWRMQNDRGYYFGSYLSAYFVVGTTKVGGC